MHEKAFQLTSKEIVDVMVALKEKRGQVFNAPKNAIADLHKLANS